MMVKLLTNLLPEEGMFNNARGAIKDIIYSKGGGYDDITQAPILVIDLPDPLRRTWVPIAAMALRCDYKCCSRCGVPIICAKADSIHSPQGLSIGDSHAISRILVNWEPKDETLWPGILYVGASRAEAEHNVAIAFEVTKQGMSKVCSNEGWIKQNNEVLRLVGRANADRQAKYNDAAGFRGGDPTKHWGSKFDFASRMDWFIVAMTAKNLLPGVPLDVKTKIPAALLQWRASLDAPGVLGGMEDDA
jgi:hypothetical protein